MNSVQTQDITDVQEDNFTVDGAADKEALSANQECWNDLAVLKDDLATTLLKFVIDIESAVTSPEVLNALGNDRAEFDKTVNVFYSDVNRFTTQIQELRNQHEHLSGGIESMEDLNLFTRLSIAYQVLQAELHSLLAPTMANIVLMIHAAIPTKMAVESTPDTKEV